MATTTCCLLAFSVLPFGTDQDHFRGGLAFAQEKSAEIKKIKEFTKIGGYATGRAKLG